MSKVTVPVINIESLFKDDFEAKLKTAKEIGTACKEVGFFVIIGHNIDENIINEAWISTKEFFDLPLEKKMKYDMPQEEYPFGYNKLGAEILSSGKASESESNLKEVVAPDLKEMFSIGPENPASGLPSRIFPDEPSNFKQAWSNYYNSLVNLANHILRAFALALDLDSELFFEKFTDHHASALRAINYPDIEVGESILPGQLRASAHTDYGTITILRADGPGLQVSKDKNPPTWCDVPHVENGFIINLGDLMRRWTNDEWLSTLHRVIIADSDLQKTDDSMLIKEKIRRRQSMAFFHNINRDAIVEVILKNKTDTPKHKPIIAGDFLMQKHLASFSSPKN